MKIRFFLILTVLLYFSCFVVTCSESDYYEDVEVTIVSTFTTTLSNSVSQRANVRYTIKNTGTKTINGWKVFFSVYLQRGPQFTAYDYVYYTLEPGKISSAQITKVLIPSYYEKASGAFLRHIETW
jgi:magnesium-transporting ATPase (P-type)